MELERLSRKIERWGNALGFDQIGITDINLQRAEGRLERWLKDKFHGEMEYMARHGSKRSHPEELCPGTLRVISARLNYWPGESSEKLWNLLENPDQAYVSRYALGRDYHKILRRRLQQLATQIETETGSFGYRVFTDSAPVLEKPLAEKAGLGWIGKHTNLINRQAGSWFFLGEIYTDLPLPPNTQREPDHCGNCQACIDVCPTGAIVAPYRLDARRCISYLTIELKGAIPVEFRPLIGNRIFGCDDCQLVCPWNRFAQTAELPDFTPRHSLESISLVELMNWDEATFLARTTGSAIRRIGYERWQRNLAVALGNVPNPTPKVVTTLEQQRASNPSELVREHLDWALVQHRERPE
ncbi:MAG: tRNA epoxyqueuosine(34) reductase QueG [Gammaproteobacteria bacterium]|nr:tRNA epoxyqueuosine(34) reductase QueG [Gammaproteobacteria bacterium]